ncbi:MAG: acyl-CoA dehydrogenase [Pseudomonadota bacterium]
MDFTYSDEQQMLRDSVDRFGAETWAAADRLRLLADADAVTARSWAQMAELGWLMLPIAESDGGLGGTAADVMAVVEGFGRHLMPEPYVTSCVLVPALLAGSVNAGAVLDAIGSGQARAAAGFYESGGGYDLSHVALAAERVGDGWRLSGEKLHVEDGGDADWFVVSARTAGAAHEDRGIGLFLVPRDAPGLSVDRLRAIDGHRHAALRLDNVTRATAIGEPEDALPRIEAAVDRAIAAHLAEAVGSIEAANAATLDYLRTRHQFGVAIGSFQVLQHRAVDMAVAAEEARSMLYHATLNLDRATPVRRRAVAAAKTRVGQTGLYIARQAVQLHGGVGTSDELIVSHHLKRQMMLDLAHGPSDHHRARFAAAA